MVVEKIVTVIKVKDQLTKALLRSTRMVEKFSDTTRRTVTTVRDMSRGMTKMTRVTKTMKGNFRRFNFELLSTLFFGMAIQRLFVGMLNPALKLVGMFELFSVTMGVLFLPVALALLEVMLPILQWFIDLPEPTKFAIGVFVLLAAAVGSLLFILSVLGLGIKGLQLLWVKLASPLTKIMGLLGLPFLIILAILAAAVIGFWLAWKENFGNIREWVQVIFNGVKNIFAGIKKVISGFIDIFIGFFSGDGEKIKEGFKKIWDGIVQAAGGFVDALIGIIVTLGLSLFRAVIGGAKSIVTLLGEAFGLLWEKLLVPAFEFGKNLFDKIVAGIKSRLGGLGRGIKKVLGIGGGGSVGSRQAGGFIPQTGLFKLHAGETVVPANQSITASPTINIFTSGGVDTGTISRMKSELGEIIARELASLSRR